MDSRQHERSVSPRALLSTLRQRAAWDAIAPYRPAIVTFGGGMFSAALAPLALWHLFGGRWAIAAVTAVASALVLLTASGTWLIGVDALLWAYPAALVIHFIVPTRAAHAVALVHVLACTTVTALKLGVDVGLRVAVTMSLPIVYINVVMGVIGRLQQSLEQEAMTDALTGTLNRRRFDGELASHSAVAEGRFLDGRAVTVSVGVTMNPSPREVERWLQLSDKALYEAKRTGRNRIVFGESSP